MESEHVKGITEQEKKNDGEVLVQGKTREFSSSSSSSSTCSSSSLEFDINEKVPFVDSSAKSKFDGDMLSGQESVSSPDITNQTPPWSILSTSPPLSQELSNASPDGISQPMKSPPIQTMGQQPAGYDPNRIPASVFSTKVTNPSEWSVASNESLFSIHMGNNSFSRDNMFGKSGELPRLDESESKSRELSSSLPPVMEVPAHEENSGTPGKVSGDFHDSANHEKEKMATANASDLKGSLPAENSLTSSSIPRTSTSNARLSDESGNSSSSFAFPVLVNTDAGKTASLGGVPENPEKPQLQEQDSKAATPPATTTGGWFSSFSCFNCC